ncbi:hypothetical protein HALLA_07665 [Halostagnicola larsenii XH-48]|uniref:Uncharacterized protein n=1 Tax=Halostagnicola larsenii XH-48 TaxID=797299 RepID=W0JN71_9EURY|nr:hypothetical protein [Halostagnicola larsenii]AHF98751.1 hypothetical protein HALLA_07665 [Halostagnicola larsenii XH-48]
MDATADELAGVVDLFGGLSRDELERALSEAAFRADGSSIDEHALSEAIDDGLESFTLLECPAERVTTDETALDPETTFLVSGPAAFPTVPEYAEDVPHILDIDRRRFDRGVLGRAARERFTDAVEAALDGETDDDRLRDLLEVSYDIETWGPVELSDERAHIEEGLD